MNLGKFGEMVRDRETWRASVHGITKSRTRLGGRTTAFLKNKSDDLYKEASCQRHHKNGLLLPRWFSGKGSACPAGDMGLIPDPEDPSCHGTTKPMHPNYRACTLEPRSFNTEPTCRDHWAPAPQSPCSTREATVMRSPRLLLENSPHLQQLKKACVQQWRSSTAKNK